MNKIFFKPILLLTIILTFNSCQKKEVATIQTNPVEAITLTSIITGGNVDHEGGADVIERGIVWSTNPNPTLSDNKILKGSGFGIFRVELEGLQPNSTYYFRAFATNKVGTSYGVQRVYSTTVGCTDADGNNYRTIMAGNKEWMAENLKSSKYANGDPIPNVSDESEWGSSTTGAWAHFNNDSNNDEPYGKLYNWYVIADSRNVCPTGWHVPNNTEWTDLIDLLGGMDAALDKLKSTGNEHWVSLNQNASNSIGFSALPGGHRDSNGTFDPYTDFGYLGWWWTSTTDQWGLNPKYVMLMNSNSSNGSVQISSDNTKKSGYSIRCVKD
ncbi:MAG: fibrobacter succinogenes major paralogous domain-containing protein [Bacteroidota bacterium]